jgi:hypothetical protein
MTANGRYMSPTEFGRLLADLRITDNMFQDRFLEFLEEQRMVIPAARIRWPRALVIEEHGGSPQPPVTAENRAHAAALSGALHTWNRFDADPAAEHPLDMKETPGAALLSKDTAADGFQPWTEFRTNIRGPGDQPVYTRDAVDTFYHAWQALLAADAAEMGIHLVVDTRQPEILGLAVGGELAALAQLPHFARVSFEAPRGLTASLSWSVYFDAAARVNVVRHRKLAALSRNHTGYPRPFTNTEQSDFENTQKLAAKQALSEIGGTRERTIAFLRYLCERWDSWTSRGRVEIANEYRRQIAFAARMAMLGYDVDFQTVAEEVGRVTGHFERTLDVVFPDWQREARDNLERSLRSGVLPHTSAADRLTLADRDVGDLCDWLERRRSLKLHLSIEEMLKRQFSTDPVDRSALAKEVESLAITFEHMINEMFDEVGVVSDGTLMSKMLRLWDEDTDVHTILDTYKTLVSTRGGITRGDRLTAIAAIPGTLPKRELGQTLLRVVLNRNSGTHKAMANWSEEELHAATRDFLAALMFCRKQMLVNPPKP